MRRLAIVILLILQSYVYAGPVCGNHATTVESMACCENGHPTDTAPAMGDSHSESCCATCDMGKGSAIPRRQKDSFSPAMDPHAVLPPVLAHIVPELSLSFDFVWKQEKFGSYTPPELFLLNQSFLI